MHMAGVGAGVDNSWLLPFSRQMKGRTRRLQLLLALTVFDQPL